MTVDPKPYRFRILSVANERTFNLSWFLACGRHAVHSHRGRNLPDSDRGRHCYLSPKSAWSPL